MTDIINSQIKVVDVGVEFSHFWGLPVGLLLIFMALIFGKQHGDVFFATCGFVLLMLSIFQVLRIFSVKIAKKHSMKLEEITIELFKRPGPAGSIPRYRIMVKASLFKGDAKKIRTFLFNQDNYYENLSDATLMANAIKQSPQVFINFFGQFFVSNQVSKARKSEAVALFASSILIFAASYFLHLIL